MSAPLWVWAAFGFSALIWLWIGYALLTDPSQFEPPDPGPRHPAPLNIRDLLAGNCNHR